MCSEAEVCHFNPDGISVLDSIVNKIKSVEPKRMSRYFLIIVSVFILIALAEQLFSAYATKNYHSDIKVSALQKNSTKDTVYNVQTITENHLLGQFNRTITKQKKLPTTNLKLTLRGAFTSNNPQHASAMIEGPDRKTQSYKVKGKVYGNTVLHSVFSNRVVLSRGGQLETLYFPAVKDTPNQNSQDPSDQNVQQNSTPSAQRYASASSSKVNPKLRSNAAMTKEQRKQLIKDRLQELRNRSKK